MKISVFLFLIFFCLSLVSQGKEVTGIYETDFGELTLKHVGQKVTGTYTHADGRIEGSIIGNTLTGWWYQNNGKGRFKFVFASDFSSFAGTWGYNDDDHSRTWNGKRTGELVLVDTDNSGITGVYKTDFNDMIITRRDNQIGGNYKHENGRISGVLEGNVVKGTWQQNNGEGTFIFVFASDFSSFEGKWGSNNETPASQWNGKKYGSSGSSGTAHSGKTVSTQSGSVYSSSKNGVSNQLSGVFETDFNKLTFYQSGNAVTGNYEHANGKIEGTLNGNVLTGWWYQDNGKGKFSFVFNSDFSSFEGKWGSNEETPTSQWNGRKTRASGHVINVPKKPNASISNQLSGTFETDFNKLTFYQSGKAVTGNYEHSNGKIEGTLNGNVLTGWWYQDNGKGRFKFVFNSNFSSFKGTWGYNNEDSTGTWNGTK